MNVPLIVPSHTKLGNETLLIVPACCLETGIVRLYAVSRTLGYSPSGLAFYQFVREPYYSFQP